MKLQRTQGYKIIKDWLSSKGYKPFAYQEEAWQQIINGQSGLVNAPTGTGKTFSVFLGAVIAFINQHPKDYQTKSKNGLQLIWVTPLRALAKDIGRAMEEVIDELGMQWKVGIRNGDTSAADRAKQKRQAPEVLIITPESMHLLLAQKGAMDVFKTLNIIAVDEWHELMGSKRGVQMELALSRITAPPPPKGGLADAQPSPVNHTSSDSANPKKEELINSNKVSSSKIKLEKKTGSLQSGQHSEALANPPLGGGGPVAIWGISATIGNLEEAKDVLLSSIQSSPENDVSNNIDSLQSEPRSEALANPPLGGGGAVVRSILHKRITIESILPDEIEKYPWAGHLGIRLAEKLIPIIDASRTTLIFVNTRGQSELWYQTMLTVAPHLAGAIALHHGSIDMELRTWIEEALHEGKLKAVVCTASLDLGVDFRPVETVVQVGSPKGVARFLQRAGRSGHQPDAVSKIYFLPTHSLELIEAAALKKAVAAQLIESRPPLSLCYDVLVQYLGTLACGDGFYPDQIFEEVKRTWCFRELTKEEWNEMLYFITSGGNALQQYDEYKKVEVLNGLYKITSRRIALRHRLHIGTIVSDNMMKVKFMTGGYVGVIEESFISRLEPGDAFTLAGRQLELVAVKEMTALVKKSTKKKSIIPSWMGGRLPLSESLGKVLRQTLNEVTADNTQSAIANRQSPIELQALRPLFALQRSLSHLPGANELLIEQIETRDGFHLFVYPFEGRLVHEAMAALLAYRIGQLLPITFSIAMNDYGFELLSDQPIPVDDSNVYELFTPDNLIEDIQRSVNSTEMAKRKFRDIAVIGGLIFQGFPGEYKKTRHLQASAGLLFNVFNEYDSRNVLIRQAYQEVFDIQMEEVRLRDMLQRVQASKIILTYPERYTPFCFPIKVDSMRENLTSEKLADRVRRMQEQLESLS